MKMKEIEAIDVHSHFGEYIGAPSELTNLFMSGDAGLVAHYSRLANIKYSVVSPMLALLPRGNNDPVAGNILGERVATETDIFLQWAVVDPLKPVTYAQAERMLEHPKCVGIKIHPEEHCYPIKKYGGSLFEFAARHHTVIISHSGEQNSLPEDFVWFADEYPEVRLIISHLGLGWDGNPCHQVHAIQKCRNHNIYTDTSSAQSIMPNLVEWAVNEIGSDRILFGTDCPCNYPPMQRARIDNADICDEDKKKILCDNAKKLLNSFFGNV